MISTLKLATFRAARYSGISALIKSSAWRSSRVLVLCYHGIALDDEHEWNPALFISASRFRERMEILRDEGCVVLPLSEAIARCAAGTLPPRSVALTFDDGSVDFIERVLPILQEFRFPATVYLTTYYCNRGVPVPDVAVSYLLWKGRHLKQLAFDGLLGIQGVLPVGTSEERARVLELAAEWMTKSSTDAKTAAVELLSQRVGYRTGEFFSTRILQIMSSDEVRALPRELVDVELHTHRHRTPENRDEFLKELRDNDVLIRQLRVRPPQHFCYPSGVFRSDMVPVLEQMKVESATTCRSGMLSPSTDLMFIPRLVDTMNISDEMFRAWVGGTAGLLPRRH